MTAPAFSAQPRIFRVMAVLGRPGVSDAPTTATVRGWKNVSRSMARSSTGRPVRSRRMGVGCRAVRGMRLLTIMSVSCGRRHVVKIREEIREAVIVDAVRTPIGKRNGALSGWHPTDLLGHVLIALVGRSGVDPEVIDDVVGGCVTQGGEQSTNVTRNAWVGARLPW